MRNAQRQFPPAAHVHKHPGLRLVKQVKPNFILHVLNAPHAVGINGLAQQRVAVWRIMKTRDGFAQRFGGKIRQLVLEGSEGHAALHQVVRRFGLIQAKAVRHKLIQPPKFAVPDGQVALAVQRRHQRQHMARVVVLLAEMVRYSDKVSHQCRHITEHMMVDPLQNIAVRPVRHQQIRVVDMSVSIPGTAQRISLQLKAPINFFHCENHPSKATITP